MTEDLQEFAARLTKLEYHVRKLIDLADSDRHPFTYHMIEAGATEQQVEAIYELMDKTLEEIKAGRGPSHHAFEQKVYEIMPSRSGDYHFAEGVVSSLNTTHQYEDVYKHMQKDGMNI